MVLRHSGLLILLLMCGAATAQTQYVSDDLVITMRTGPSTQNAIIRNLRSGDAVSVLETNDDGYSRVRLADGDTEGWVLTRYLTSDRVARDLLAVAERDLATARTRVQELESELATVSGDLQETRSELTETSSQNSSMSTELADIRQASANAVALRDQNESLRRRVNELTAQLDRTSMENAELASRSRQNWFVVGAAVLLAGVVMGLIAPTFRRRRTTSW